jgi:EpsI family protein
MSATRRAIILSGVMTATAATTAAVRHRAQQGTKAVPPELARHIPESFGEWKLLPMPAQIVNPQTQQILDAIYSETLVRTYVNARNYAVMMSLAYGNDQRGGLEAHRPEVCYPAQGFVLHDQLDQPLASNFGTIPTRRLRTSMGPRHEPVTYWFAMSSAIASSTFDQRVARLRSTLTGAIPDGILFRVSSIDTQAPRAWKVHDDFIAALLEGTPAATRARLVGRAS